MPNINLVNQIWRLREGATPTEQFVLKLAASLIWQIDEKETGQPDERFRLVDDEFDWIPEGFEYYGGMLRPKRWPIPERIGAAQREREAI